MPPIYLRIILLLGLITHKAVWEILKRPGNSSEKKPVKDGSWVKFIVKSGKVAVLIFLLAQTIILPYIFPISDQPELLSLLGLAIFLIGLVIAIIGRIQLGRNWANLEDYQVLRGQQLVQTGIYQYIRHPIYAGDLLLVLGLELALNSWLFLMVIPLAIIVFMQAKNEEQVLSRSFANYGEYQKQSKMFIPFVI